MDIIWRWATSIALIMLSFQFVAGCGTEKVRDAVLVAILITIFHAGLKVLWSRLQLKYFSNTLFVMALLVFNVLIISLLAVTTPIVYMVDHNSALIVIGFITFVGSFVQLIPPLSEEKNAPVKKKVLH